MKKYNKPQMDAIKLEATDVITASDGLTENGTLELDGKLTITGINDADAIDMMK